MSNEINLELKYKPKFDELFEKYKQLEYAERGYAASKMIYSDSIMFIGLNPSFTDGAKKEDAGFYELDPDQHHLSYFKKFIDVTNRIKEQLGKDDLKWSHWDMLLLRETQQSNVSNLMKDENGLGFIWEQLQFSKEILELSKPKVMVVCNTLARMFLGKDKNTENNTNIWLDYDSQFDDEIGTHRITNQDSNLKNVPVFFTSMLSGQRALDNGSYERLVWQIKRALEIENN